MSRRVIALEAGTWAAAAGRSVVRHVRIARQFARIGVLRKSQFRVEFASQVIMDCFWYATKIGVFEALFQYTRTIAGWSAAEVRVFLGMLFVADAFMMMWLGQKWRFGRDLKDGKLDPLRTRPGSPAFLYFFQQFSLEAVFNLAVGSSYLAFGLWRVGALGSPATWLKLPLAVVMAWWCITVMSVFFSIVEFWILNSDLSSVLHQAFDVAGANPADVFTARIRFVLVFFIPVGVMVYVPASLLLGRMSLGQWLVHAAWIAAFGLLTFRAWRWSFRKYESAMG